MQEILAQNNETIINQGDIQVQSNKAKEVIMQPKNGCVYLFINLFVFFGSIILSSLIGVFSNSGIAMGICLPILVAMWFISIVCFC